MNCKPGDLAIVIRGNVPENTGRIVRVLNFLGEVPGFPGTDWWRCEVVGRPARMLDGGMRHVGMSRDCDLRPVSGLPDTENMDIETPVPNSATKVPA